MGQCNKWKKCVQKCHLLACTQLPSKKLKPIFLELLPWVDLRLKNPTSCFHIINSTLLVLECSEFPLARRSIDHSHPRLKCLRKFSPYMDFQHVATSDKAGNTSENGVLLLVYLATDCQTTLTPCGWFMSLRKTVPTAEIKEVFICFY